MNLSLFTVLEMELVGAEFDMDHGGRDIFADAQWEFSFDMAFPVAFPAGAELDSMWSPSSVQSGGVGDDLYVPPLVLDGDFDGAAVSTSTPSAPTSPGREGYRTFVIRGNRLVGGSTTLVHSPAAKVPAVEEIKAPKAKVLKAKEPRKKRTYNLKNHDKRPALVFDRRLKAMAERSLAAADAERLAAAERLRAAEAVRAFTKRARVAMWDHADFLGALIKVTVPPEAFNEFLAGMQLAKYADRIDEGVRRVDAVLAGHPALIAGFESFLPPYHARFRTLPILVTE